MSYNLGSFNREGQIGEAEAVELEAASDSDAAKSDEVETEVVDADADADGDGHDDQTGEFVEGNQEAADSVADEEA